MFDNMYCPHWGTHTKLSKSLSKTHCLCFNLAFSTSKITVQNNFKTQLPPLTTQGRSHCYSCVSVHTIVIDCNTLWTTPSPSVQTSTPTTIKHKFSSDGNSILPSKSSTRDDLISVRTSLSSPTSYQIAPQQRFPLTFPFSDFCSTCISVNSLQSCLSYPIVETWKILHQCPSEKHRHHVYLHATWHLLYNVLICLVSCLTFSVSFLLLHMWLSLS